MKINFLCTLFTLLLYWPINCAADPRAPTIHFDNGVLLFTNEIVDGYLMKRYPIDNIVDEIIFTAWVYEKEGTPRISIVIPPELPLTKIGLVNGYAKNETVYFNNNRINELLIKYNGNTIKWILSDAEANTQYYNFDNGIVGNIELIVNKVYPGKMYQDTCISELVIFSNGLKLSSGNYVASSGGEYPTYTVYLSREKIKEFPAEMILEVVFLNNGDHIALVHAGEMYANGVTIINAKSRAMDVFLEDVNIMPQTLSWSDGIMSGVEFYGEGGKPFTRPVKLP